MIGHYVEINIRDEIEYLDEKAELVPEHDILSTGTNFLTARYNLLKLLTPTATQNRLNYLVDLV